MKWSVCFLFIAVLLTPGALWGGEWRDDFRGAKLNEAWDTITDRPDKKGFVKVQGGKLLLHNVGHFLHEKKDGRPLVLRDAPKDGKFSIFALLDADPPAPADSYWMGLFVVGSAKNDREMAKNFSHLVFGGQRGRKSDIKVSGSSAIDDNFVEGTGQIDVPPWPIYLRLEKNGKLNKASYKHKAEAEWQPIGLPWEDGMEAPAKVGFGILNNWGGAEKLTLVADFFTLDGRDVQPFAVEPGGKLATTWGKLKSLR